MANCLKSFLSAFQRSSSREYLLTTRLVHELGVAAAVSGYDLLVYLPTVDADGFDVIFDDRDRLVAMQLKSMVAGGKAADWKIRRSLLRPRAEDADIFGFKYPRSAAGRGGGVILTTSTAVGEAIEVVYSYLICLCYRRCGPISFIDRSLRCGGCYACVRNWNPRVADL